jgi:secreted PhoX family phosphatase
MRDLIFIAIISTSVFSSQLTFSPLTLAQSEAELSSTRVSKTAQFRDTSYTLEFKEILHTSQKLKGSPLPFGTLVDKDMRALHTKDGALKISTSVDSNSILQVGRQNYLVTHLESSPGVLYATSLIRQGESIVPLKTSPIDFSSVGGTLINCAGSKTPWNTHLGGEEDYSLNSLYADASSPFYISCEENKGVFTGKEGDFCSYVSDMQEYLKDYAIDKSNGYRGKSFTPYNYGYIIEAGFDPEGTSQVAKHYVTGKYTPELALVMPDQKTFYMSDDGNGKGLYKFVSDEKIKGFVKNWSGTLYMAKAQQISKRDGGEFAISWIRLGHSSDTEIKSEIDKGIKLSDIFDVKELQDGRCYEGYKHIFEDARSYCLRLKDAKESSLFKDNEALKNAAGFLESRKYGIYLGGTSEFVKEEGITYDEERNVIYMAMSSIKGAMLDDYKTIESANDIRLEKNICGAVYELSLEKDFSVTKMKALVLGKALKENEAYADNYQCSPFQVSNPDNILYIGDNTLLIGEDTTSHLSNMLWAYNTKDKVLTRIATLPIGTEVTGLFKADVEGKKAIFMNLQHPFEDIPVNAKGQKVKEKFLKEIPLSQKNGRIGYIGFTKIKP